jgi:hypothetical protein
MHEHDGTVLVVHHEKKGWGLSTMNFGERYLKPESHRLA